MKLRILLGLAIAVLVAGCFAGSNVGNVLQQSGRCATLINAAVNGSAPTGNLQGVDWSSHIQALVGQYNPDIVVMNFVGNAFGADDDAAWPGTSSPLRSLRSGRDDQALPACDLLAPPPPRPPLPRDP
jgi:hypothetical protein